MSRECWLVLALLVPGLIPLACRRENPQESDSANSRPPVGSAGSTGAPSQAPTSGTSIPVRPNAPTRPSRLSAPVMTLDLGNGVTMRLVRIPAGVFLMGSPPGEGGRRRDEGPQRKVTIARPFWLGMHEVTRGQFNAFASATTYETTAEKEGWAYTWMGDAAQKDRGVSWREPMFAQTDSHPVVCVSWHDAVAFCKWLSVTSGKAVSLPTEAQWEYACRAGSRGRFSFGESNGELCRYANYADMESYPSPWRDRQHYDGHSHTSPAGSFEPNAWGLRDMHGNVSEWCGDLYRPYTNAETRDRTGPISGKACVFRGGSWRSPPKRCRSASRRRRPPDSRCSDLGFRIVVQARDED